MSTRFHKGFWQVTGGGALIVLGLACWVHGHIHHDLSWCLAFPPLGCLGGWLAGRGTRYCIDRDEAAAPSQAAADQQDAAASMGVRWNVLARNYPPESVQRLRRVAHAFLLTDEEWDPPFLGCSPMREVRFLSENDDNATHEWRELSSAAQARAAWESLVALIDRLRADPRTRERTEALVDAFAADPIISLRSDLNLLATLRYLSEQTDGAGPFDGACVAQDVAQRARDLLDRPPNLLVAPPAPTRSAPEAAGGRKEEHSIPVGGVCDPTRMGWGEAPEHRSDRGSAREGAAPTDGLIPEPIRKMAV